jgi:hypothetical protein
MKDSMEYIVQEASKTSYSYVNRKISEIQSNLDTLKISMVFNGDYQNTKNRMFDMEAKFGNVRSMQELCEQKMHELYMILDGKIGMKQYSDDQKIATVNFK